MKSNSDNVITIGTAGAYLKGAQAAVTFADKSYFAPADADAKSVTVNNETYKYIPWGANDTLPVDLVNSIYKNPTLARGTEFNIVALFGKGIKPVLKNQDGSISELSSQDPVSLFFENNDINSWFLEVCTDMQHFFNAFNEIILSEKGDSILQLNHLEAVFSRLQERNDKGEVLNSFYCAKFGTEEQIKDGDVEISRCLFPKNLVNKLEFLTGKQSGSKDTKLRRFTVPINFPTPGRIYYQRPYWTSIIDSGWLDFANKIPEFKKALMTNQMTIKYQIILSEEYFPFIFAQEGITDPKAQKTRVAKEFENLNKFLTDTKNTAKSIISFAKKFHTPKGAEMLSLIDIKPIENNFKGGEYIQDSEEASNIICFALGVHPAIIGASPGKNGSINGTEARELFNLKRALLFPYRWQMLRILYAIKRFNKWPENLYFSIDDVALTTLDNDKTGMSTITTVY